MPSAAAFARQEKNKKHPKQTKEPHQNQHSGAWGTGLLFPKRARVAVSCPAPRSRHLLGSRRLHHCHLQAFTHRVSRPTGGIRNSKFSKQFQHFQYICWAFSMIHGQIKFSTSHTFKEEKHENDLSFKI